MSLHLADTRLVDLAESGQSDPHLADCERCRSRVAELRALIRAAGEDDLSEPSPLFWDHFAARVAQQVQAERRPSAQKARVWRRVAVLRAAALVAASVLVITVVSWRSGVFAPERVPRPAPAPAAVEAPNLAAATQEASDEDETWALVTGAATDLDLDSATGVGFELQPGAADMAAAQLSGEEQRELVRLLKAAVARQE